MSKPATHSLEGSKAERGKAWHTYAYKMHKRSQSQWVTRWAHPERVSLTLHEIRKQELFKDLGHDTWIDYLKGEWAVQRIQVGQWEHCSRLFVRYPDALKICASQGLEAIGKISQFVALCETKEDVLWWSRLARVMSQNELRRTVNAQREARRTGYPGISSVFLGGFVDGQTYENVVRPAYKEAKKALGASCPPGLLIAWLCAKARGKVFHHPLGLDLRSIRSNDPRPVYQSEPTGGALVGGLGDSGEDD